MIFERNLAGHPKLSPISFGLLFLALFLYLISLAAPYWAFGITDKNVQVSIGVWMYCLTNITQIECHYIGQFHLLTDVQKGLLLGLQVLVIVVLVLMMGAAHMLGRKITQNYQGISLTTSITLSGTAVLLLLVATTAYAGNFHHVQSFVPGAQLDFAYGLSIGVMVVCVVAEVFMIKEHVSVRVTPT
ncbi:uncharacterized protein LOC134244131 isoform X1 [Saccostrea cucullata]|uniref:uncharacterized protein LOC134244131 isoform X1 n=1 Tax=Saccostrea cuccullata TaxID=36930 RepID=UPI002ED2E4BA